MIYVYIYIQYLYADVWIQIDRCCIGAKNTPHLQVTSGDAMQGSKHQRCLGSPCLIIQQVGEMDVPKKLTNINEAIERKKGSN